MSDPNKVINDIFPEVSPEERSALRQRCEKETNGQYDPIIYEALSDYPLYVDDFIEIHKGSISDDNMLSLLRDMPISGENSFSKWLTIKSSDLPDFVSRTRKMLSDNSCSEISIGHLEEVARILICRSSEPVIALLIKLLKLMGINDEIAERIKEFIPLKTKRDVLLQESAALKNLVEKTRNSIGVIADLCLKFEEFTREYSKKLTIDISEGLRRVLEFGGTDFCPSTGHQRIAQLEEEAAQLTEGMKKILADIVQMFRPKA